MLNALEIGKKMLPINRDIKTTKSNSTKVEYKHVEFVGYRPHPGELVIREDGDVRVIYRRQLYARKKVI